MLHRRKQNKADTSPPSAAPSSPPPAKSGMQVRHPRAHLGEILVEEGVITKAQLEEALKRREVSGGFIGQALIELKFIDRNTLMSFLVKQCKIPHISLLDYTLSEELFDLVPKELCVEHRLLPIDKLGRILTIAMVDPLDIEALEEVRSTCPDLKIKPILCDWEHYVQVARRVLQAEQPASQDLSASSFGLAAQAARPQSAPEATAEEEAALDAAVEALVEESGQERGHAAPEKPAKEPPVEEKAPAKPRTGPGPAPETTAAPVGTDPAVAEALQALQQVVETAQTSQAEQARREERLTQLTEAAIHAAQVATRASSGDEGREDKAGGDSGNLARFPGGARKGSPGPQLTKPERDALEAIEGPGVRSRADERVREALESERPLKDYTFEDFFTGDANAFTMKLTRAVTEHPGREINPFFVYGDIGTGKTHLINAMGNEYLSGNPDLRVGYMSAGRFVNRLHHAVRDNAIDRFREAYYHWDVLILDDIQLLGGRPEAQEEFYHVFDALHYEARQLVIASDAPPEKIPELSKRLVSRFAGGVVASLEPPEHDTRMAILRRHVKAVGVDVADEVLSIIAARITTDIRRMSGSLRKVVAFAGLVGQDITCDLAREILSHLGEGEAA
jgi:chromosomal replication initiator protein DnaA